MAPAEDKLSFMRRAGSRGGAWVRWSLVGVLAAVGASALAGDSGAATRAPALPTDDYEDTVRPILARLCFDCHGETKQKGAVRLDDLDPDFVHGPDAEEWHFALDMIQGAEMPPAKATQFTDEERRAVVRWIEEGLEAAKRARDGGGRTPLRRLTRAQYARTLQDLLHLDIDFADRLPPDARSRTGFTNSGEALAASRLHLETIQEIARAAVDEALPLGPRPETVGYRVRFGKGIGEGHVAARTGGYQSLPMDTDDFVIDVLGPEGRPREPASKEERETLDRLRRKMSIGLRGSSQGRFRVTDEGLVMYGAVPHKEKAPGAWQGPSPNVKLETQRVFPEAGTLRMTVVAGRGRIWESREPVLVPLGDDPARVSLENGAPVAGASAIVMTAVSSDQRTNVENEGDLLVPVDVTKDSKARLLARIPAEGYYQMDLVHPRVAPEMMPQVRVRHGKLNLDVRPEGAAAGGRTVTVVGAAYLRAGNQHLEVGGPFFTGFSHLVLTPLPKDHALVQQLSARTSDLEEAVRDDDPVIRVFAGTRTDDGMDYLCFGEPTQVTGAAGEVQTYQFFGRLDNLPVPAPESGDTEPLSGFLLLGLWNHNLVKDRSDTGPPLLVKSIQVEAPFVPNGPTAAHREIFAATCYSEGGPEHWWELISRFLDRAFRRPTSGVDRAPYERFFNALVAEGMTREEAMREVVVAALCSPRMLYLVEPEPGDGEAARPVDEYALASRLSYFLWNSPPDGELTMLAGRGQLRDRLASQVDRMLDDPRASRFVRAFTPEWLRLDRLELATIDPDRYPGFTRFVKEDMREETLRFVEHVLRTDAPVDDLIDSGYAMLNQNLAEYYGIDGVRGPAFRPVPVERGSGRGGLLGHGAFLAGHSDGQQPHPILRAVWLKEKLLADPPPPPPPNVPDLDPTAPGFQNLTLKEQLELHRDSASCRDCHAGIDPWGIAFEGMGAAGLPEKKRKGRPVDASTTLPDGSPIDGVAALKAHLIAERRLDVAAAVVHHVFAYALGRDVSFADEDALAAILEKTAASGHSLRSIVRETCLSPAFQR